MEATTTDTANSPMTSRDTPVRKAQHLRLRRFAMAFCTYVVVGFAAVLMTRLGLGRMSASQWEIFLAVGAFGNGLFLILFLTGANLHFSDPSLTREQIVYSALWGLTAMYFLPEARPIVIMFFIPAFSFGMLRLTRSQYLAVVFIVMGMYAGLLCLEYFQHQRPFNIRYELFLFALLAILLIWFALFGGFISKLRYRLQSQRKQIQQANDDLQDALRKVKALSGLLPICASCKKIRDDAGYWNQIESYIRDHSEAEFSHSICPECAKKLYPNLDIHSDKED